MRLLALTHAEWKILRIVHFNIFCRVDIISASHFGNTSFRTLISATLHFGNPSLRQAFISAKLHFGKPSFRQPWKNIFKPSIRQHFISATLQFGKPSFRQNFKKFLNLFSAKIMTHIMIIQYSLYNIIESQVYKGML